MKRRSGQAYDWIGDKKWKGVDCLEWGKGNEFEGEVGKLLKMKIRDQRQGEKKERTARKGREVEGAIGLRLDPDPTSMGVFH